MNLLGQAQALLYDHTAAKHGGLKTRGSKVRLRTMLGAEVLEGVAKDLVGVRKSL